MGVLIRLWEKAFGIPHRHENAEKAAAASDELITATRALTARLKPYVESADPLQALVNDVMKTRRMNGTRAKFHP